MKKKIYQIPVTWDVYSTIEVEAESLEEAVDIAMENRPLPTDPEYVDSSLRLSYDKDDMKDLMKEVKYIDEFGNDITEYSI